MIERKRTPLVMGILNVTPDSFHDGGRYAEPAAAVDHALGMIAEGADIIDVGGESTRPGSSPVEAAEQIRRTQPVIERLRERNADIPISIDTTLSEVARAALDAGANIVNDISALRGDPALAPLIAERQASVILMHMQGTPHTMQQNPHYDDVVGEITSFLKQRIDYAISQGIARERIIVDPGIGFGKTVEHNVQIMAHLDAFKACGCPVLIGPSRKSFVRKLLATTDPDDVLHGTLACVAAAALSGVDIIRVHDVAPAKKTVALCREIRRAGQNPPGND